MSASIRESRQAIPKGERGRRSRTRGAALQPVQGFGRMVGAHYSDECVFERLGTRSQFGYGVHRHQLSVVDNGHAVAQALRHSETDLIDQNLLHEPGAHSVDAFERARPARTAPGDGSGHALGIVANQFGWLAVQFGQRQQLPRPVARHGPRQSIHSSHELELGAVEHLWAGERTAPHFS